jgi:glutamyl/glutaminyl-tRNA synthetase
VLRAKIDLAHPNMIMRDPLLLRIRHAHHYRRGDAWCIYPLYDYAHGLSDAIEGITHSLCTLEFKDNKDIYDWLVREAGFERPPEQTEFARLVLDYTVVSKRKLLKLVDEGHVSGWDDPRMPTLAGIRRRGVTPEAIRDFCDTVGVARKDARTELAAYEHAVRNDLNMRVPRVMCVVDPLKVVITNYPAGQTDQLEASYYPHDVPLTGSRMVPFSREIYVERSDFMEDAPKKFFRLSVGREVRSATAISSPAPTSSRIGRERHELRCTYDPATRGGDAPDGRKVQGTIHWVSAAHAVDAELRLYDRLFTVPDPEGVPEGQDFTSVLNPQSLVTVPGAKVEPSVAADPSAPGISSSGPDTSCPTRWTPRPESRYSTGPSRSGIPGPRKRPGRRLGDRPSSLLGQRLDLVDLPWRLADPFQTVRGDHVYVLDPDPGVLIAFHRRAHPGLERPVLRRVGQDVELPGGDIDPRLDDERVPFLEGPVAEIRLDGIVHLEPQPVGDAVDRPERDLLAGARRSGAVGRPGRIEGRGRRLDQPQRGQAPGPDVERGIHRPPGWTFPVSSFAPPPPDRRGPSGTGPSGPGCRSR